MPIYDQTYRHWEGSLKQRTFRWWVIAASGLRKATKKKVFDLLLILALLPFVFLAAYVVVTLGILDSLVPDFLMKGLKGLMEYAPVNARFFANFLQIERVFLLILTVFAGASLIANDLRGNALAFYLARPITRFDYVAGKLSVILILVCTITLVPGLVLFVLKAFFSTDHAFLKAYYWLPVSIVGYSVLGGFFLGLLMLSFSATNRNPRDAALKFLGTVFFSDILAMLLGKITGKEAFSCLSLRSDFAQILHRLFGLKPDRDLPFPMEFVVPLAVMALSAWVIFRKIEKAEGVR